MSTTTMDATYVVEIKKLQYFAAGSQETNNFVCDVWVNGLKFGDASNEGHGGPTSISPDSRNYSDLRAIDYYFKSLPPIIDKDFLFEGKPFEMPQSFENEVDRLVDEFINAKEKAKFAKKMEKNMLTALVVGDGESTYWMIKYQWPMEKVMTDVMARLRLKQTISKYVKSGEINSTDKRVLNTNLSHEMLVHLNYELKHNAPKNV